MSSDFEYDEAGEDEFSGEGYQEDIVNNNAGGFSSEEDEEREGLSDAQGNPVHPNLFVELTSKILQQKAASKADLDKLEKYDETALFHTRGCRAKMIEDVSEKEIRNAPLEKRNKAILWLLLNFISIGDRKSQTSMRIEKILTDNPCSFFTESQFINLILLKIKQRGFCKTKLRFSNVDDKKKFSDIVGDREQDMRCALELLREADRQERAFFHTDALKAHIQTTLTLAKRVFSIPNITQEALMTEIDPKTISDEAQEILRHYFSQFDLSDEEKTGCMLQ